MEYTCTQVETHVNAPHHAHGHLFLDWHRDYIQGLEDYLISQNLDHLVPLPYWHPCTPVPGPLPNNENSAITTCEGYTPMMDITNQDFPCEPFDSDKYSCGGMCDFESFEEFQSTLAQDHNGVHRMFGPTTFLGSDSPSVLLFWLWHSYVDDLYLKYQAATVA